MTNLLRQFAGSSNPVTAASSFFGTPEPRAVTSQGQAFSRSTIKALKKAGFDLTPLGAATRLRLRRLQSEVVAAAPRGAPRPRTVTSDSGKVYKYRSPGRAGQLKRDLAKPGVFKMSKSGKTITIDLSGKKAEAYARAVDRGRRAVTITPKNAKVLMFRPGVFVTQVRQKARKGQFYVKKGIANFVSKFGDGMKVRWKKQEGLTVEP